MVEHKPAVTILCDFDGTISPVDLADFLYRKFAACGLFYSEQWEQKLISTREEILLTFATVSAGRDEIAASLADIPIDPSFHELAALARQKGMTLAVVSDGLDWSIQTVLAAHGITGLPVYANHVVFEGHKMSFEFPWYDPSTPLAGVCKPLIVRRYQQNGGRVVFVGDGRSDHEAVQEADLIFAKDALAEYCRQQGIAALAYHSFTDICGQLIPWLAQLGE